MAKGHIKRYPVYLVTMEMHVKATAHPDENSWWHQILVRTKATGALLCPWRGPSALRSLGNGSSFRSETCPPCSPAVPALDACPGGVETHIPTVLGMNAHSCFIRSLRTGNNACVHSPVELPVRARCPAVEGSWPLMGRTASGCCPAHWKPDTNESITWNSRKSVTALPCQGGSAVSGGPGRAEEGRSECSVPRVRRQCSSVSFVPLHHTAHVQCVCHTLCQLHFHEVAF